MVPLTACLYLAAKVNEYELAKIRDIINVVMFTLKTQQDPEDEESLFKSFRSHSCITLKDYTEARERVLEQEQ